MSSADVLSLLRSIDESALTEDGQGLRHLQAGRARQEGLRLWVETPLGSAYYYVVPKSLEPLASDLRPDALSMVPLRDRLEALAEAADVVDDLRDQVARLISAETGKELSASSEEVEAAVDFLRRVGSLFQGRPSSARGLLLTPSSPDLWSSVSIMSARGIALVLPPFTAPFFGAMAGAGVAIAAGLPVIIKAPWQSAASSIAAALALRGTDVGEHVSAAPFRGSPLASGVSAVILFGRPETSTAVWRETGIRPSANCSGRSALVLCSEPSDIESLAKSVVELSFSHAGQACGSVRWVLARRDLARGLVDSMVDIAEQLSVGSPLEGKNVGPLRSRGLVERAHRLVNDAVAKGATQEVELRSSGNYASPAILSGVPRGADILWTDLQAPVVAVSEFDSCSEAVETAAMMRGATHALVYGSLSLAESLASSRQGLIVVSLKGESVAPSRGPCYVVGDPVKALSGGPELWGESLLLF